jgi:hypothetical protein
MEITIATMGRLMKNLAMGFAYFAGVGADAVLASARTF